MSMKPTVTAWLLPSLAMVAMLSRRVDAYGAEPSETLLPPLSSPITFSYDRQKCTAFIHSTRNCPMKQFPKNKLRNNHYQRHECNQSYNVKVPKSVRSCSTRLALSSSSPSPWSPGEWKITLDFGRDESSSSDTDENLQLSNVLGEDWGSNGGRLVLSFEIIADAETDTVAGENSVKMAWLGGKPTGTVECIPQYDDDGESCASYINNKGQQDVQIAPGQWRIEPPLPLLPSYANILPGQASTLRFHLTLLTSIQRNTISFPEDQILLLQSNTFRTQQYSSGVRTLLPYQYAKEMSQQQLEEQLNHETGDRRLDGKDLFETLGGYKDVAELVLERDEKRRKWKEVEGVLPKLDSSINTGRRVDIDKLLQDERRWGIWPGDTELMSIERGVILAVAASESKQKMGFFPWMQDGGAVEEPVVVGKWSALPLFDDDIN